MEKYRLHFVDKTTLTVTVIYFAKLLNKSDKFIEGNKDNKTFYINQENIIFFTVLDNDNNSDAD